MAKELEPDHQSLIADWHGPLVGRFVLVDGHFEVQYYTSLEEAQAATTEDDVQAALAAIGSWSDLDWDELVDDLDRIRHSSKPTPPIDLDEFE